MKTRIKHLLLVPLLMAGLGLMLAGRVTAQTFTTLYSFTGDSDGANPEAGLILSNNTLYGTTYGGGSGGKGTVFKVNTDGTGFTNLHSFIGSDGANPHAGLILSGNTLYGATSPFDSSGYGTVFAVNTDGTGFTNLHSFPATPASYPYTNSDGAFPYTGLILSGNTLYGTAERGGSSGNGTIFAISTDGTGFTNLHNFNGGSDGAVPIAGLVLSSNTLYGVAENGGSGGGTVFAVNTDGMGFTNLHSFIHSDGVNPIARLILLGNTLYGTAKFGSSSDNGTVFGINSDGSGFTVLHTFTALFGPPQPFYTNSDGAYGGSELILLGNALCGTSPDGGTSGIGTVFTLGTNGSGFTTLHNFKVPNAGIFTTNSDGARPFAGLILSGNTLCGTTHEGGSSGGGTVFSLSLAPQLTIVRSGANVVLSWPTNVAGFDYTGFTLQSTTNLVSPAVWSTNSPSPVIVNGQNTVTNPASETQTFYRLSQ